MRSSAAAPDRRVLILTRSGFAGVQRYAAASWSGDISSTWTALRKQLAAGLGFAISGMPYWTFDSKTSSNYTGQRGDNYTVYETRTVTRDGKTTTERVPVTRVRWTSVSGHVARDFDDVLVLASNSLPRAVTERLEPWDLPNVKPFADEYLSGFRTERYQVDLGQGSAMAREKMEAVIHLVSPPPEPAQHALEDAAVARPRTRRLSRF